MQSSLIVLWPTNARHNSNLLSSFLLTKTDFGSPTQSCYIAVRECSNLYVMSELPAPTAAMPSLISASAINGTIRTRPRSAATAVDDRREGCGCGDNNGVDLLMQYTVWSLQWNHHQVMNINVYDFCIVIRSSLHSHRNDFSHRIYMLRSSQRQSHRVMRNSA